MSDQSPNLALPYIMPGQAQKHVTHNEALRILDGLVQLSVLDRDLAAPPATPADGDRYIVASGATGEWAGWDLNVALWIDGAWLRLLPRTGWRAWVEDEGLLLVYDGAAWSDSAPDDLNVQTLGVNASASATNRLAVVSPATLFSHDGAGHQVKINKATSSDTASLLFQTGWSGRAEMGTAGSDSFAVKVSPDGSAWTTALSVAPNGNVQLGGGLSVPGLISGAAVAATTDDTAGRLLQTGAGGLLRRLSQLADFNTAPAHGARIDVWASMFTPNRPANVLRGLLLSGRASDARWVQFAFGEGGAALRTSSNLGASWTEWERFFTSANLVGGVAQSGGIPTGAVIERGANANGEFLRLADGTQICWRSTLSAANASTALGALFRSADVVWTFPASFAAAPAVAAQVTGDADVWAACGTVGATSASLRALAAVSKPGALTLCAIATGRWF